MATSLQITRNLNGSVKDIRWVARDKFSYYVQISFDLITWDTYAGPYPGEDDTEYLLPIPATDSNANFRLLISIASDYDIPAFTITAFDGTYVILQWENLGPAANNASYKVLRDGAVIATRPATVASYKDNTVQSGKTYRYSVRLDTT